MPASDLKLTRKVTSLQALSKILLKKRHNKRCRHRNHFIKFRQTSLVFVLLLIDLDNVSGGWAPFKAQLLYKNQQNFDEAKCSFFEGFQYQKVLILSLFSMKHFYFFMAKITPNMAEITSPWD